MSTTPITGGSNANLAATSSTPIRIGSVHGTSSSASAHQMDATTGQQSSSVPTAAVAAAGHLQLQSQASLSMGSSNQSLAVTTTGAGSGGGGGSGGGAGGSSITPPNSAGLRQSSGIANWATDSRDKYDGNQTDKTPNDSSKLNRKESYKAQRKNYRREKKRVASELLNTLQDPSVVVLADWLKVRGTLKSWTKLWCVLKPGLLLLYKSPKIKSSHWVGTILLNSCQVIERPSKKDGFCFKLFHPLEQSIWAPRGPDKETIGAVVQPLPTAYLIFRAPSQAAGKCWMDALELSLRCSALLLRSNSNSAVIHSTSLNDSEQISHETQWSEADYEKHFNEHDLDDGAAAAVSGADTETDSDVDIEMLETPYMPVYEEEFGEQVGEQVEELADENKSLIWCLVKQVRPGMDLSKVVLPTFILEPRSFLDKLSDSYYHADILSRAVTEDDPFTRMKTIVQWYLSGFYKKPKGLKKPYNPILGETFRCYWEHPNGSRTFYIAEQVSHHPPISAFYVTNRQDGFCISCSILAKSKFYGNSTSAVLDGVATLTLLPRGESYTLTTPYAHCKGILVGTLSMELGGKINIECENTGYKTELEFKLKPFLGGNENTNLVVGKIKLQNKTLATISGHWDSEMLIKDSKTGEESVLFAVTSETKQKRLTRYLVPLDSQMPTESEKLWLQVSIAIHKDDQVGATEQKTILEEAQRAATRERSNMYLEWDPKHFELDLRNDRWIYKYADLRAWDPRTDVKQYESNYRVLTKTRHKAPMVRTGSTVGSEPLQLIQMPALLKGKPRRGKMTSNNDKSDSSQSADETCKTITDDKSMRRLALAVEQVNRALDEHTRQLALIHTKLERLQYAPPVRGSSVTHSTSMSIDSRMRIGGVLPQSLPQTLVIKTVVYSFLGMFLCLFIKWLFK